VREMLGVAEMLAVNELVKLGDDVGGLELEGEARNERVPLGLAGELERLAGGVPD